jgi:hypothetical protein
MIKDTLNTCQRHEKALHEAQSPKNVIIHTSTAKKDKITALISRLLENAEAVRYGEVGLSLKIHDGRVTGITHTISESTRERG